MPIHPVVNTLMWIVSLACMFYPIVPMIRYHIESWRKQKELWSELEEEIRKLEADPRNYSVKKFR